MTRKSVPLAETAPASTATQVAGLTRKEFTATIAPPSGETNQFIDEPELLRRLPISRRTAGNHRKAGKLPFVRLGKRILYHWPTVLGCLIRQQRGAE